MKLISINAAIALLAVLCFGEATAQTPVREAAAQVAAALAGDRAARQALVRDRFAPRMLEERGAGEWEAFLDDVAAASGGIDIVSEQPGETERFAELLVRARNAPRYAWLVLGVSRADPTRISTLFLLPARDPDAAQANAWPQTRLSRTQLSAEIGRRVDALAREDLFSGAVLIARRGELVHEHYVGWADRAARVDAHTRFNLGSTGKMFTAVAAAQLIEQGRLSLGDTVARWIPEYPDEAGRAIIVEQLLAHTSGLGDFFGPQYRAAPEAYSSAASYLPLIARPPSFEPGSRFAYSNAGYALLGVIVERAAGEDYVDHIERAIFAPARMRDAGFPALSAPLPERAVGYFRTASDAFATGERRTNENAIAFRGNAAGGAYATARDMLAFSRALFANRLITAESRALLLTPRNDFAGARIPTRYGYGFSSQTCAGRAFVGHGGGGPQSGVNATLLASEDGEWTIVVLSNYDPSPEDLAHELCEFLARQ